MKYDLWIKDKRSGMVHRYGSNRHDSLVIEDDGQSIIYRNLQNGECSHVWSDYLICIDENGTLPKDDPLRQQYGAECFVNIGGVDADFWILMVKKLIIDRAFGYASKKMREAFSELLREVDKIELDMIRERRKKEGGDNDEGTRDNDSGNETVPEQ